MTENEQFKIQLEVERLREKYSGLANLSQYEIIMFAFSKIDEREATLTDGGWKCPACGAKRKERFSHCVACGQALRRAKVDIKEFAKLINGKERGYPQFTKGEMQAARENGFVIACSIPDSLIVFDGAVKGDGICFGGGKVFFNHDEVYQGYNKEKYPYWINVVWCGGETDEIGRKITWTYETEIPHETFMIYEDGEPFCRGIVFKVEDLK